MSRGELNHAETRIPRYSALALALGSVLVVVLATAALSTGVPWLVPFWALPLVLVSGLECLSAIRIQRGRRPDYLRMLAVVHIPTAVALLAFAFQGASFGASFVGALIVGLVGSALLARRAHWPMLGTMGLLFLVANAIVAAWVAGLLPASLTGELYD